MALILTTLLIAVGALALPNPNATNRLLPREFPAARGISQGSDFDSLTFTIYADTKCKGRPAGIYTGSYGYYEAYQMQSYHLSRELLGNKVLDFFAGSGNNIDLTLNSHYTRACWQYDTTAGVNASTDDTPDEHHGTEPGCHTLDKNEWCAMIWLQEPPK